MKISKDRQEEINAVLKSLHEKKVGSIYVASDGNIFTSSDAANLHRGSGVKVLPYIGGEVDFNDFSAYAVAAEKKTDKVAAKPKK